MKCICKLKPQQGVAYLVAGICALLLAVPAYALPWSYDFETNSVGEALTNIVAGVGSWSASTNNCVVTNDAFSGTISTNSAYVPAGEILTNAVSGVADAKVWLDTYVKATFMEYASNTTLNASASAMFYFATNGYPVVQDGSSTNWIMLSQNIAGGSVTKVVIGDWVRITICRNYTDKDWALFINGELTRDNIQFINTGNSSHTEMSVENETFMDDIWIDSVRPTNAAPSGFTNITCDVDSDGMWDAWEVDYFDDVNQLGGDDYDHDGSSNVEEFNGGTDPTDPADPVSWPVALPYREDFEGATNNHTIAAGGWHGLTNTGTAIVQESTVLQGSRALSVSSGTLGLTVNTTATNVWIQVYAKPGFYDDDNGTPDDLAGNTVAAFYFNMNGQIVAYSGSAWTTQDQGVVTSVPSDTWLGIATHLDYAFDNWDLYISTNGSFGEAMRKVNTAPMAFASAQSNFTNMTIESESTAYLDVLAVSLGYLTNNVNNTNVIAYDRLAGQTQHASIPPYDYTGTNATLAGDMGRDLFRGLLNGDKLSIFFTNGWNTYALEWSTETNWIKDTASSLDVTNLTVLRKMTMNLERGAGDDNVVFYPYGPEPSEGDLLILGTNNAIAKGWNQIMSPFIETRTCNAATFNWGFSGAQMGDRIYIGRDRLIYNGTKWTKSGGVVWKTWSPGEGIWYYHKGIGYTWSP